MERLWEWVELDRPHHRYLLMSLTWTGTYWQGSHLSHQLLLPSYQVRQARVSVVGDTPYSTGHVSLRLTRERGAEFPLHFEIGPRLPLSEELFPWGARYDFQDNRDEKAIAGNEAARTSPRV